MGTVEALDTQSQRDTQTNDPWEEKKKKRGLKAQETETKCQIQG